MKNKFNILSIFFLLILSCCSTQKIIQEKKFKKFDHINKYDADFAEQKENILLTIKKFSEEQSEKIFDVNVIGCGYQPIQVTISNYSNDVVYLGPANIGLNITSPKKVAKECHWKTFELTTAAGSLSCIFFWPALLPVAYCGYKMKNANVEISKKIIQQDLIQCWDNITVLPFETISRIFFVSNYCFKNNFYISLFSKTSKNLEFNVVLN